MISWASSCGFVNFGGSQRQRGLGRVFERDLVGLLQFRQLSMETAAARARQVFERDLVGLLQFRQLSRETAAARARSGF